MQRGVGVERRVRASVFPRAEVEHGGVGGNDDVSRKPLIGDEEGQWDAAVREPGLLGNGRERVRRTACGGVDELKAQCAAPVVGECCVEARVLFALYVVE